MAGAVPFRSSDVIVDVETSVRADGWNGLLAQNDSASVHQTTAWADYYTQAFGARPWFLTARAAHHPARASLLVLETSLYPQFGGGQWVRNLAKRAVNRFSGRVFRWVDGPVVTGGTSEQAVSLVDGLLGRVLALARQHEVAMVRVATESHVEPAEPFASAFETAGYRSRRWATYVIDLDGPEETLWARIDRGSGRSPVRQAQRTGVTVRRLGERDELAAFIACEREHAREHGLSSRPVERVYALWDALHPAGMLQIFVAEHGGQPVGYMPVKMFNRHMHLIKPVRAGGGRAASMAGDLMLWEAMCWGQSNGYRWFDLSGVSPTPGDGAEQGIRHFKKKWGGRYVEYREWSLRLDDSRPGGTA